MATPSKSKDSKTLPVDLLLGWFIPGAGHLIRGYKRQGLMTLGVVVPMFLFGLILSDFEAVSRELHPYAFYAELGVAGGTLPLLALSPASDHVLPLARSISTYENVPAWNDTGVLFCCIAGLLNFLALFDLLDRSLSPPRAARKEAAPEGSAS